VKFMNGFWLPGNGYKTIHATQPYEVTTTLNSITVLATTSVIKNMGMTLNSSTLEITFSSTAKNCIKVHIVHFKGGVDTSPKFDLNEDQGYTPIVTNTENAVQLISGDTKVEIIKGEQWDVNFYFGDKRITGANWRSTGYSKQDPYRLRAESRLKEGNHFFEPPINKDGAYTFERLDLGVGECIYGFGEKFTAFVKNGQAVDIWNSDGGTCSEQSYKSVPFYISSKGYGVLVNSADLISFEVGSEVVSKVSIAAPGEELEYFIIGGSDLKEVLSTYTALSGRPSLPPPYSFGLWLSTSFTTDYDEKTVNEFIDGMSEREIPLQVFHFDCLWMKEHEWCNMEWDTSRFSDPQGMLARLKEKGLEFCIWTNPYIGQRSKLFDIGKANGFFIKNPDGSVFQADLWQPGMAIIDFTNPAACEWYSNLLKKLFDMGIRNIKSDFGERIPTNVIYHSGQDPVHMHNYYSYLYNKVVANALRDYFGENQSCLFARSATVGSQKFPVHWGGDCFASYPAMAETLRAGLSLCSSGFGFFSHDIGGFEATATPDLYKRWCAFGLLSTHSRLHGSESYRVPWLFDEESCDVLRFYTILKGRLMPYLFAQAVKTHKTGIPMMRSMVIEFMDDPVCKYLDTQYMLGDSLLVAPIMNEQGVVEFYLPKGIWTDIISGESYQGGQYYTQTRSYTEMPILARENSIIGYGKFTTTFDYDFVDGTEFVIYNLKDGATSSVDVCDSAGLKIFTVKAVREKNKIYVSTSPFGKRATVRISGYRETYEISGDVVEIDLSSFDGKATE